MAKTPSDDMPGFLVEKPEHCSACFCLIRPGQTYYLTMAHQGLCSDCASVEEIIRVREVGNCSGCRIPPGRKPSISRLSCAR